MHRLLRLFRWGTYINVDSLSFTEQAAAEHEERHYDNDHENHQNGHYPCATSPSFTVCHFQFLLLIVERTLEKTFEKVVSTFSTASELNLLIFVVTLADLRRRCDCCGNCVS